MDGLNKFLDKRVVVTHKDGTVYCGTVTDYAQPLDNDRPYEGIALDIGIWLDGDEIRSIKKV